MPTRYKTLERIMKSIKSAGKNIGDNISLNDLFVHIEMHGTMSEKMKPDFARGLANAGFIKLAEDGTFVILKEVV